MKRRVTAAGALGQVWAFVWGVLCVVPFFLIILLAFKTNTDIFSKPLALFGVNWKPENFADAWNGPVGGQPLWTYIINSVVVLVVAVGGCVLLGSFTAYFATLASTRVRMAVIRGFLVATTMPLIMLLIPYYMALNWLSLLSTPWSLGVIYVALCLPTCVLILHSFYLGFPAELREAGAIDGLGMWGVFVRIVLPLSRGPITAVAMMSGFFVWGETQLAIALLQLPQSRTLPVGILDFQGQFYANTGAMFAGLTIATVPIIIVYLIFNRAIAKGVALGGVFR